MAADRAFLLARAPELATIPTAEVEAALMDAALVIDPANFGSLANQAIAYLAAHNLLMGHTELAVQRVVSESVGPISTTYAQTLLPRVNADLLNETARGRQLLLLTQQVSDVVGGMVI